MKNFESINEILDFAINAEQEAEKAFHAPLLQPEDRGEFPG